MMAERALLIRTFGGFFLLWLVMDRGAAWLGSYRGEMGVVVAVTVIATAMALEKTLFGTSWSGVLRALGLSLPQKRGLLAGFGLSALLLSFFPVYAWLNGLSLGISQDAAFLVIGLFAQGGIAEELVFRGYLFGHLRTEHRFWRAAWLATIPFFLVHLVLFATMSFPLALAATLLSLAISFPLAHLYEISGRSIWPPAILHFVVQGAIKLVVVPDNEMMPMAVAWMALAATAPYLLFFIKRPAAA
jgi:membrane protease YdiL (CAAX protease family)